MALECLKCFLKCYVYTLADISVGGVGYISTRILE